MGARQSAPLVKDGHAKTPRGLKGSNKPPKHTLPENSTSTRSIKAVEIPEISESLADPNASHATTPKRIRNGEHAGALRLAAGCTGGHGVHRGGSVIPSLREFSLAELTEATDRFSEARRVEESEGGSVFRGSLRLADDAGGEAKAPYQGNPIDLGHSDHNTHGCACGGYGDDDTGGQGGRTDVAIRVLEGSAGKRGRGDWMRDVMCLDELRHPNLLQLIGCCAQGDHRLLVHELMSLGPLDRILFDQSAPPLPWHARMKIALHAARGLAYLHEDADRQVIYRHLNTKHILLDEHFNAKLSDHGLTFEGADGARAMGSLRRSYYLSPQYIMTGQMTAKSDIYSFGVVLLEMISGWQPARSSGDNSSCSSTSIVDWARPFLDDPRRVLALVDPRLGGDFSVCAAQRAAAVARNCLGRKPRQRPQMSDVVNLLESIQGLNDRPGGVEEWR